MTIDESTAPQPPIKSQVSLGRVVFGLIFWVVLPLVVGWYLSRWTIPTPAVGIIRLNLDIYSYSAQLVGDQVEEARKDSRIKAVVFQVDSPGGEVAPTQTMYFDLLDLRKKMPVVGSIDSMAASGGFYAIMATDPIYSKPSSTVGNVGVWGYFPPTMGVNDTVLASGPFKLTASNSEQFQREIEGIKLEFLETVRASRGTRLVTSIDDLSQGLAYPGRQAQELGLVDYMGSESEAIRKAAELAGIAHYDVVDLETIVLNRYLQESGYIKPWSGAPDAKTGERKLLPGLYLLYDVRLGSTRR